jgi:hypothetical protein
MAASLLLIPYGRYMHVTGHTSPSPNTATAHWSTTWCRCGNVYSCTTMPAIVDCYPHGCPNGFTSWHSRQRFSSPPRHSRLRPFGMGLSGGSDALEELCSAASNIDLLIVSHQLPFSPCHATPCRSYRLPPPMVPRCEQRYRDGNLTSNIRHNARAPPRVTSLLT